MADKEKTKMKDGIIKRGGSYAAAVYVGRDEDGKKKYKWVSSPDKQEVKRLAAELRSSHLNGTYTTPKGTLGEFIERWLRDYAKNLAPRTYEGYQSIFRSGINKEIKWPSKKQVSPPLADVLLRDLKPERIQRYYSDKLESGDKPTTVRHHHMMLHRALEYAVKLQLLPRNPADATTPPPIQHAQMHTVDEDGIDNILEAAKDTPYHGLFHCFLYTGLRRSELLALRWCDVDLTNAEISVSRALHQLYNGEIVIRGTKSARSARKVSLVPESVEVLQKHLDQEMALWFSLHKKQTGNEVTVEPFPGDRLVFCQWDGKPLRPNSISQAWRRLIQRLGYNGVRLHDARHTHASLMMKAGIHPKVVQERLGHSSISITLDLYSHVAPGMQKEAAKIFGELMHGKRISKGLADNSYVK